MAYDTSKLVTLGQAMTIAQRTREVSKEDINDIDAAGIAYGDTTVGAALDDLLYEEIAISSFTNTVGTVEIGSTVDECTFKWTINKTPTTLTLGGDSIDVDLTSITLTEMGLTLTAAGSKSYSLVATDEREASASKSTNIYFYNGVYCGVSSETEAENIDSAFILAMTKYLQNSKAKTFTVEPGEGEYIFYALPTRLGTPTFYVGGFEGGFDLLATIDFTNASGFTESYDVYKSTNANLGSTSVTVS
ncbi:MAG: hypothetical protein LUD12_10150 [Lachnospiraceae bacterium]|nr:hypothetical protein [Lachnospiraceae bacterium]